MKKLWKIGPRTAHDYVEIGPFDKLEDARKYFKKERPQYTDDVMNICIKSYYVEEKEMYQKDYEKFSSFDLYNFLLKRKHKDEAIIATILKNRGEIDLLYSLFINK